MSINVIDETQSSPVECSNACPFLIHGKIDYFIYKKEIMRTEVDEEKIDRSLLRGKRFSMLKGIPLLWAFHLAFLKSRISVFSPLF